MRIESIGPLHQPDPKGKSDENFLRQDSIAKKRRYYPDKIELSKDRISTEKIGYDGGFKKASVNSAYNKNLKGIVKSYLNRQMVSEPSDIRHEIITEVRNKINMGFYNDPENIASIADKIIDYYLNP
jgi:hypothetical protein